MIIDWLYPLDINNIPEIFLVLTGFLKPRRLIGVGETKSVNIYVNNNFTWFQLISVNFICINNNNKLINKYELILLDFYEWPLQVHFPKK